MLKNPDGTYFMIMKKELLTATDTWVRGAYMLMYFVIFWLAKVLVISVSLLQFLILLATGKTNPRLVEFGKRLSVFIYQLFLFLTFASNEKPFPFNDWPRYVPIETPPPESPASGMDTPENKPG